MVQILTIDRHDDAAQTSNTVKLPGYSGQAGLPSNDEVRPAEALLPPAGGGVL